MKKYPFVELLKMNGCVVENDFMRVRNHLPFNNGINLSIQASVNHYCNPRKTLDDLNEYNSFEIMAINDDGESYIPEYAKEYYDGAILSFVPKEIVHKLVEEYIEKYGFKEFSDLAFYKAVTV